MVDLTAQTGAGEIWDELFIEDIRHWRVFMEESAATPREVQPRERRTFAEGRRRRGSNPGPSSDFDPVVAPD